LPRLLAPAFPEKKKKKRRMSLDLESLSSTRQATVVWTVLFASALEAGLEPALGLLLANQKAAPGCAC